MSAKTSRPRIHSVASATSSQIGMGTAMLVAFAVTAAAKLLSVATRQVLSRVTKALSQEALTTINSLANVRKEHAQLKAQAAVIDNHAGLLPVEAAKIAILAPLMASSYRSVDEARLNNQLKSLCVAATLSEVQRTGQELIQQLETQHQQVLISRLRLAVSAAAIRCGFSDIETPTGPEGAIRVIASNPSGRTLVTEITADAEGHCRIETEVVGVADGSCNEILDAYDKALEAEGVRSDRPKRAFTGGICELAAARDFVRSKVSRADAMQPSSSSATIKGSGVRRSQQLNTGQVIGNSRGGDT